MVCNTVTRLLVGISASVLVHQSSGTQIPAIPASLKASPIVTVRLNQQDVPVIVNNVTIAHKTAFFGHLYIGHPIPQKFSVVYDTGSAHLFVPSSKCKEEACVVHKQYDSRLSDSAILLEHDGTIVKDADEPRDRLSVTYGTGKIIGDFVKDYVCLGEAADSDKDISAQSHCVNIRIITALEMTTDPFKEFAFDGVLGLGMEALALHPDFNIFHMMAGRGTMEPVFGFFLSTTPGVKTEISFGGYDQQRIAAPLRYVPVNEPERGYWQIKVYGLTVGDEHFDVCDGGACQAIVDTGTSLLGVPPEIVQRMHLGLARRVPEGLPDVNCRQFPGPTVTFDLGAFQIDISSEEYSQQVPITLSNATNGWPTNSTICRSTLFPISMPFLGPHVFLFGEPVLRKYYTAYDMREKRIGFSLAAKPVVKHDAQISPDAEVFM